MSFYRHLVFCFALLHTHFCFAFSDLWDATNLIELKQGSELSSKMSMYQAGGGYELSGGAPVNLKSWYAPTFVDARITYLTQVHRKIGLIWGFSTGETAQKYTIDPSLKFGLVFRHEFDKNSSISFKGTTIVSGRLRESPCTADYGEIGGVQQVNCRLAASPLQPAQTLQYLYNEKPYNFNMLWLQYARSFN